MSIVTVSSKFQIPITKEAREKLAIRRGQKLALIIKGSGLHYVPVPTIKELQKKFRGADRSNIREETER